MNLNEVTPEMIEALAVMRDVIKRGVRNPQDSNEGIESADHLIRAFQVLEAGGAFREIDRRVAFQNSPHYVSPE